MVVRNADISCLHEDRIDSKIDDLVRLVEKDLTDDASIDSKKKHKVEFDDRLRKDVKFIFREYVKKCENSSTVMINLQISVDYCKVYIDIKSLIGKVKAAGYNSTYKTEEGRFKEYWVTDVNGCSHKFIADPKSELLTGRSVSVAGNILDYTDMESYEQELVVFSHVQRSTVLHKIIHIDGFYINKDDAKKD